VALSTRPVHTGDVKTTVDRQAGTFSYETDVTSDAKSVVGAARLESEAITTAGSLAQAQGFFLSRNEPTIVWTDEQMDEQGQVIEDLGRLTGPFNASRLAVSVGIVIPEGV